MLSVDAFLRALQRDVAWDFFYGTVNFDGVFGTVNHYGTVDMFAGRYNDAYRKAELDHVENFETPLIRETFKAMLDDWTNDGFDPFASPAETDKPFGVKHGSNTAGRHPAPRHGRSAWSACPATSRSAPTPPTRSTACSPTWPRTSPRSHAEPGFEDEVARVQPVRLPEPLATSRGTRRS